MRHWYREPFSTYQFYADVLFQFEHMYPGEELDLLESSRDRHGYDCVLIKRGKDKPQNRYVQLKSTERVGAQIMNIHDFMLLESYREIVQILVLDSGRCEYHGVSDMGRVAHLTLAIAGECQKAASTPHEDRVIKALGFLSEMIPGMLVPRTYAEILSRWTNVPAETLLAWDDALQKTLPRLWRKVLKPLADVYADVFQDREKGVDLSVCWTRLVKREDLIHYLFRGANESSNALQRETNVPNSRQPPIAVPQMQLASPQPAPVRIKSPPAPARKKAAFSAKAKPSRPVLDEHTSRVLADLRQHANNRPKTQAKLLSHIKTLLGNKLSEAEAGAIAEKLHRQGHIATGDKGALTYDV